MPLPNGYGDGASSDIALIGNRSLLLSLPLDIPRLVLDLPCIPALEDRRKRLVILDL